MKNVRSLFNADFSTEHVSVLQQTKIDEHSPGPLLTNIETVIDFIGTGLKTTSAYFGLPQGVLAELNEAMVDPLPHDLKRPQLRSFPTLMGLFMLLRGLGLAVGQTKPKRVVLIDPRVHERWQALNPIERYFNLTASCLYDASWDCVGMRSRGVTGLVNDLADNYLRFQERVTVFGDERFGNVYSTERSVAICLLHQLGWISLDYDATPKPGKAATVRRIERTDFGDAMFVATCNFGFYDDEMTGVLQKKLQPIFPSWKTILARPETGSREGNHTFKVSLGKVWRRIVASADVNLEQLAEAILASFQFDSEHLYQFELRDSTGNSITIAGPHLDDASHFADEMHVGELPLLIGDAMVFHYDFGDDWRFKVTLEAVVEGETSGLKMIAQSGESPEQYDQEDW